MGMKPPAVVRILPTCSHTDAQARPPKSLENTTFSCGRLVPVWQSHRPARARAGPSRGSANFCAHHTARTREGWGFRVVEIFDSPSTAHMRKDEGKVDIFDFVLEARRPHARGREPQKTSGQGRHRVPSARARGCQRMPGRGVRDPDAWSRTPWRNGGDDAGGRMERARESRNVTPLPGDAVGRRFGSCMAV